MTQFVREFAQKHNLHGRRTVVVGAGKSGIAAARLLHALGAKVRLVDASESLPAETVAEVEKVAELQTGPHSREQFADADLVVMSPGVPAKKLTPYFGDLPARKIVAELEFASWFIQAPIIAITGSNGKTTTTTLIGELLEKSGKNVFVGGNIGTPLCEYLLNMDRADVIVLEVSSFQLQNCRLFHPDVAVFLNIAPNHLDYHEDMEEYLEAKLQLFSQQTPEDLAVVHESLRPLIGERKFTEAEVVWYSSAKRFDAPHLPGEHNRANVQAAWQAVKRFGVKPREAEKIISEFRPLEHRLENIGQKNGVSFINDSKATTLEAVAAAVKSFGKSPVRLLMGGKFKGGDVAELARQMEGRVAQVGLYGASREIFEGPLKKYFPVSWDETLEQAAKRLFTHARTGDVILLSPGTSSFDQYPNYKERGGDFKRIFGELK
nr:UDP-N-acetylmuramoyl-L-alanine--D-glutamate ligase [Salidesulfovibrio onnuriiensis]